MDAPAPQTGFHAVSRTALVVGSGVAVAGIASYGFLVVSARALGPVDYAPLSAFWALVVLVGPGCFMPLEQELARALVVRRERGDGTGPVARSVALLGLAIAFVVSLGILALSDVLLREVLDGHRVLLAAFVCAMFVYGVQHLVRGLLAGHGSFGRYAVLAGTEGIVRAVAAGLLLAAGVRKPGPYGLAVVLGTVVAVSVSLVGRRGLVTSGSPARWKETTASLGSLLAASALAQVVLNAPPIAVKALASAGETALAGRFLGALVLARVPLFLFVAVQATLLPTLSAAVERRAGDEFRRIVRNMLLAVGGFGIVATPGAAVVGPGVVRLLLGHDYDLAADDMAYLVAGTVFYIGAIVLAQALVALRAQLFVVAGWALGVLGVAGGLASSPDLLLRVELSFLAGAVASWLSMAIGVRSTIHRLFDAGVTNVTIAGQSSVDNDYTA